MEIAIVGADAASLCRQSGVPARPYPAPKDAADRVWDLLALTSSAAAGPFPAALRARSLLLPGDSDPSFAQGVGALQVVGYGFSPRDTFTLSSFTGAERFLCVQRSLFTLGGTLVEPQELPLNGAFFALSDKQVLFLAGLRLLCDL